MIKACIFDLDGTLADTLDSMAYVTNIIMEKFGLKTLPVDNFRYYSGEGANMLIRRALKDAGDPELAHYDEGQRLSSGTRGDGFSGPSLGKSPRKTQKFRKSKEEASH